MVIQELLKLREANDKFFVAVKVGFDHAVGDAFEKSGFAYIVVNFDDEAKAQEFLTKVEFIDWDTKKFDDAFEKIVKSLYGPENYAFGFYTDSAKISKKEPKGQGRKQRYFGGYTADDFTFKNKRVHVAYAEPGAPHSDADREVLLRGPNRR